jgi:release factor glutamine methyltransferase
MMSVAHRILPALSSKLHSSELTFPLKLVLAGCHFYCDAICYVHHHIFDDTSLILRKAIRLNARHGSKVLDLGTGQLGLLAIYCARAFRVEVLAIDINHEFLENAKKVALASQVPHVEFRWSNWFSEVDGFYDLILGNVPYVPTQSREFLMKLNEYPEVWDGGASGITEVDKVLSQVHQFLTPSGKFLLGINTDCVPERTMLHLINVSEHLELQWIVRSWISHSEVFVISNKPSC